MPSPQSKKKKRRKGLLERCLFNGLKIILSPLIILGDSFRRKGSIDNTWLYAFFLFVTAMMSLTFMEIMVSEGALEKTLSMIADAAESREVLAGDTQPVINLINKYALQYKLDPNLIFAIIKSESDFNPEALSSAGARGLMQIMPAVWRKYSGSTTCSGQHSNKQICSENCIYNPEANIRVGVRYFHSLLQKYHGRVDLALQAYNAGILNVKPGLEPKYEETRSYVQKTITFWQELRRKWIGFRLQFSLKLRNRLKWMFGSIFLLWIILFWWMNRKFFSN